MTTDQDADEWVPMGVLHREGCTSRDASVAFVAWTECDICGGIPLYAHQSDLTD